MRGHVYEQEVKINLNNSYLLSVTFVISSTRKGRMGQWMMDGCLMDGRMDDGDHSVPLI